MDNVFVMLRCGGGGEEELGNVTLDVCQYACETRICVNYLIMFCFHLHVLLYMKLNVRKTLSDQKKAPARPDKT